MLFYTDKELPSKMIHAHVCIGRGLPRVLGVLAYPGMSFPPKRLIPYCREGSVAGGEGDRKLRGLGAVPLEIRVLGIRLHRHRVNYQHGYPG